MNVQVNRAESILPFYRRVRTGLLARMAPPPYSNGTQARIAWMLNTLILVMMAISLLAATVPWLFTPHIRLATFLPVVGLLVVSGSAHLLLRAKQLEAAATLFGVGVAIMVGILAFVSGGGVRSLAYLAMLLSILIIGTTLGTRASVMTMVGVLGYGLFLLFAEKQGFLPNAEAGFSDTATTPYFVGLAIIASILPVFVHLTQRSISEAVIRVQQTEQAQLAAARHQMRALELQDEVQKRTHELRRALEREQKLAVELQKTLERESELSRLKSQIITAVSHEFRTPLTTINTSAQLLEHYYQRLTPAKRDAQYRRIESAVYYLTNLIQNVLQVEDEAAGSTRTRREDHDVWTLCSILTTTLRDEFGAGHRLCFELNVERDARIHTNPDVVTTVLRHLISNALKFSPANRPVNVTFTLHENRLTTAVTDQGIGIPPMEQERIFELFYRAGNISTENGLGMGLHIARKLAQRLDANLHLQSQLNQGTIAVLALPLSPDA